MVGVAPAEVDASSVAADRAVPGVDRPSWWREIALGIGLFAAYLAVDHLPGAGHGRAADRNGKAILDLETWLHVDIERTLNRWLAPHELLRTLANYEYAFTYILSALGLMIWVYARRPRVYRQVRASFLWTNLLALTCFAIFPVRPPRTLDGSGFIDTVRLGHTWGSWGSPAVDGANQVAAMPSLHMGWALWVSLALARISGRFVVQAVSAVHVLVTLWVIMATGNHYLLDALGAVVVVWVGTALAELPRRGLRLRRRLADAGERVPAADAFFLHAERPDAPQHVGGLVVLDLAGGPPPTREFIQESIRAALDRLPRFHQRLSPPARWRRPRWVEAPTLDWDWHVPHFDIADTGGGMSGVHRVVAELAAEPMPRDRPMWRMVLITGVGDGLAALVMLVHHVVADGIGTVSHALHLLEPPAALPDLPRARRPGAMKQALATAVGLAQLATDGRARGTLPAGGPGRRFTTVIRPLDEIRELAHRHRARVTDVLLAGVAGALHRTVPDRLPPALRVAVPLMVRDPRSSQEGNLTAAVMIDIPTGAGPEADRLAEIARAGARLRSGTRAVASRFVMSRVGSVLPPPVHAWFARRTYGRPFFHAIASNMPGVAGQHRMFGPLMHEVYPIIPLAPGAPLAVGVLGWHGSFSMSITLDPALLPDAEQFAAAFADVLKELAG